MPSFFKAESIIDDFCWFGSVRSFEFPEPVFEPRINNQILFTSSFSLNAYQFDVFSGLRVPQIHLSVLPDQMLPGDLASPFVTETSFTNPDTGLEELVHFVRVRESEARDNGNTLTFDVPVYAVNDDGNLVQANGIFNARVPDLPNNVDVDCGDCVMVDGEGTLTVTIDVFGSTLPSFDLTTIEVFGGMEDCSATSDSSAIEEATLARMTGCVQVTATHEVPGNGPELEDFEITLPAEFFNTQVNTVAFGHEQAQRDAFLIHFADTTIEDVKRSLFVISLFPYIGDGIDIATQIVNYVQGERVDYFIGAIAAVGLAWDVASIGTAGAASFADVTAPIKAVYKLSRRSTGVIADVMQDTFSTLRRQGTRPRDIIRIFDEQYGVFKDLWRGGFGVLNKFEDLVRDVVRVSCTVATQSSGRSDVECIRNFLIDISKARENLKNLGIKLDTIQIVREIFELKKKGIGGYADLFANLKTMNSISNYNGYMFHLDQAIKLSKGNDPALRLAWLEASARSSNYPSNLPKFLGKTNADNLIEIVGNPGDLQRYLSGKRWIAEDLKTGELLANSDQAKKAIAQAGRLSQWVAEDSTNRVARIVLRGSIDRSVWDDLFNLGVYIVNPNGFTIPRP